MEGTMKEKDLKNYLKSLLDLLSNAEMPSQTIKNVVNEKADFIKGERLEKASKELEKNLYTHSPVLNNSKLSLELQIFLSWEAEYLRSTKELPDFYKPIILSLYLQGIHDLCFRINQEAQKDYSKITNSVMYLNQLIGHKEEFRHLREIFLNLMKNYCLAIDLLRREGEKICSLTEKCSSKIPKSNKGLNPFKKIIKESNIILPGTKFEILSYMKRNIPRMKSLKIETSSMMDKYEYWIREANIKLNLNLLLRVFNLNSKSKSLKPHFIENHFMIIFHEQTPKRLLESLSNNIVTICNNIPVT